MVQVPCACGIGNLEMDLERRSNDMTSGRAAVAVPMFALIASIYVWFRAQHVPLATEQKEQEEIRAVSVVPLGSSIRNNDAFVC